VDDNSMLPLGRPTLNQRSDDCLGFIAFLPEDSLHGFRIPIREVVQPANKLPDRQRGKSADRRIGIDPHLSNQHTAITTRVFPLA
jgi:hypothetical protein